MYWRPWRWTADGWYGAWIAALLASLLAEFGYWSNAPLITIVGMSGIVFGSLVAGRRADAVLAARSFAVAGLGVGIRAAALALVVWYVVLAGGTLLFQTAYPLGDRLAQVVYGAVAVPAYGAMFGGPFALLGGIVGAYVLRMVRRHGRIGIVAVAVVSIVVVVAGFVGVVSWL